MKIYYIDTNVFLRFLLKDNQDLSLKVEDYFMKAKKKTINIVLLPQIVIECEYVLRKVYNVPKQDITDVLSTLVKTPHIALINRDVMIEALDIYRQKSVDLVDIILYVTALYNNAEVLSFDKEFKKLSKV